MSEKSTEKKKLRRYTYAERRLIMEQKYFDNEIAAMLNVSIREVELERKRLTKFATPRKKYQLRTSQDRRTLTIGANNEFRRIKYSYEDDKLIIEQKLPDDEIAKLLRATEKKVKAHRYNLLKKGICSNEALKAYHGIKVKAV